MRLLRIYSFAANSFQHCDDHIIINRDSGARCKKNAFIHFIIVAALLRRMWKVELIVEAVSFSSLYYSKRLLL